MKLAILHAKHRQLRCISGYGLKCNNEKNQQALLWSSIFVTFVAKNSLDCCLDNTEVSRACKGCFAPPLAALSLTYTENSW